jgi:hypothetical protein
MRTGKRLTGDLPRTLHELCHEYASRACTSCRSPRANRFDDELVALTAGRHCFSLIGAFLIRCNIWLNGVSWLVITLSS